MRPSIESAIYYSAGIFRCFDFCTDIYYALSSEFQSEYLHYLAIVFICAPSVIFICLFVYLGLPDLFKCNCSHFSVKLGLGVMFAVLEPTGLLICIFGILLTTTSLKKVEFYVAEGITRSAGFVEGIFESLPQLVIQTYNNMLNDDWSLVNIVSMLLSGGGFLYTCVRLVYALDMIKSHEAIETEIAVKRDEEPANHLSTHHNEEEEVYQLSVFSV